MQLLTGLQFSSGGTFNSGKQRAGKYSRVVVGGTPNLAGIPVQNGNAVPLSFASWSVTLNSEDFPTVNFESYVLAADSTFDEGIVGTLSAEIQYGGDWDAANYFVNTSITNTVTGVPGIFPRDDMPNTALMTSRFEAYWYFPYSRVRSCQTSAEVHNKVLFTVSGKNQGRFWPPAGIAA